MASVGREILRPYIAQHPRVHSKSTIPCVQS